MAKIIQTTDFTGKYAISQNNFNTTDLQAFIDKFESKYIYDLLGVTLGTAFLSDIAVTTFLPPVTAKYLTIYNPINQDEPLVRSIGIKNMLLGFIYFEFVRTQTVQNTLTGNVLNQNEVASVVDWSSTGVYSNYNEAVETYRFIQSYVLDNSATYPEFKGLMKTFAHPLV
jgi:hypothetical protein